MEYRSLGSVGAWERYPSGVLLGAPVVAAVGVAAGAAGEAAM
jgi:hypothetical protein